MKKVILTLAFVLATGTAFMNANTTDNKTSEYFIFGDCTAEAWSYGTWAGEDNPALEYMATNYFFEKYCNEDGSYKE